MVNTKHRVIKTNEFVFFLGLILLEVRFFMVNLELVRYLSPILDLSTTLIFLICILIKMQKKELTRGNFVRMIIVIAFGLLSLAITKKPFVLKTGLIILSAEGIRFKTIIRTDLFIKTSILISVMLLYFSGIINTSFTSVRGEILRNSWGFRHPNTLGLILTIIFFELSYLYGKGRNVWKIILSVMFIAFIYLVPNSRSPLYVIVFYLVISFLKNKVNESFLNKIIFRKNLLFMLFSAVSIIMVFLYTNSPVIINIDTGIMSNRIYYQKLAFENTGLSLLGKNISENTILDNSYIYVLLGYGVSIYYFYYSIYKKLFNSIMDDKQIELLIIIVSILLYGVFENSLTNIICNLFVLYPFCSKELKHA